MKCFRLGQSRKKTNLRKLISKMRNLAQNRWKAIIFSSENWKADSWWILGISRTQFSTSLIFRKNMILICGSGYSEIRLFTMKTYVFSSTKKLLRLSAKTNNASPSTKNKEIWTKTPQNEKRVNLHREIRFIYRCGIIQLNRV